MRGVGPRWAGVDLAALTGPCRTSLGAVLLALDTATRRSPSRSPTATGCWPSAPRSTPAGTASCSRRRSTACSREAGVDRARPRPRSPSASGRGRSPGCGSGWSPRACSARCSASRCSACAPWTCWPSAPGSTGAFRVVTDARRKEVYWAAYDDRTSGGPGASTGRTSSARRRGVDGPGRSAPVPRCTPTPSRPPRAAAPAAADLPLGRAAACRPLDPDPLYLRRPDAVEPGARKSVLSRPTAVTGDVDPAPDALVGRRGGARPWRRSCSRTRGRSRPSGPSSRTCPRRGTTWWPRTGARSSATPGWSRPATRPTCRPSAVARRPRRVAASAASCCDALLDEARRRGCRRGAARGARRERRGAGALRRARLRADRRAPRLLPAGGHRRLCCDCARGCACKGLARD